MVNVGHERFRYWRKIIGFHEAYYKLKYENRNPLQAIATICAERNGSITSGEGEFLQHKVRRGY